MTSTRFVKNPRKLWEAYRLGRDLHTRPSRLYDVHPKLTAFYFDRAVETFGRALEARIKVVAEGQKNQKSAERRAQQELDKWLSSADPAGSAPTKGRFRDPFAEGLISGA